MTARLIGIARRGARRAPMQTCDEIAVSLLHGLEGDHKGAKFPNRQVTVMAIEDWLSANADIDRVSPDCALPWTARRANLLVEGVALPRAAGAIITIGEVELEITGQTVPCKRMDEAAPGLRRALHPEWRGGITCRVTQAGHLRLGDDVAVLVSPPERRVRLPG